ncbi:GntR family transcriptional regulator [Roseomonas eburnea]|uniref:GntR family transcriptional regulator n=1 Tax=Neoroseomonas eburnea TaxID=1346889 RepID=A0A9X9XBJ5_9PROT|nr:GntR family transcriptional regulator [Neoroseomonas eburnea]MBR0681081.1 GntR family transcriptional regulator [Neoroseomonas eburnea]
MDMDTALAPVDREESLAGKVYRRLRAALMSGRLAPGQRLVHRMLAQELGVSPTPVREALLRLVSEGALDLDARGIAWVPRLAPDRYAEIMDLRTELEGRAAARAAGLVTAEEVAELRAIHARLIEGRRIGDAQTVLTENERFHFRIIAIARMPVLQRVVESLWVQAGPTINLLFDPPQPTSLQGHPHAALLDALEAHDAEGARAAIVRDLREHGALLAELLKANRSGPPADAGTLG